MHFAFTDKDCLYLGLDYLGGGTIYYHLRKMSRFTEVQSKFIIGCIILALEYIHGSGIIHRNIKPSNILLESSGYARLTGLGLSKFWNPIDMYDTSGDPSYMAPEVLFRQSHSVASDFYSLGVLAYEFMLGKKPYTGHTRVEIRESIKKQQITILKKEIPENWSHMAADFIFKCLQRKPGNRLGVDGAQEVKNHVWFNGLDFPRLALKQVPPPFVPVANKSFDLTMLPLIKDGMSKKFRAKKREKIGILFNGYYYNRLDSNQDDSKREIAIPMESKRKSAPKHEIELVEDDDGSDRNMYAN